MMHLFILLLAALIGGCGSSSPEPETSTPTNTSNPPDADPQNVGTVQASNPGTDPTTEQAYTQSFGSNYCDSLASSLSCWGDVAITDTGVEQLFIGSEMICLSHSWSNSDITQRSLICYGHNQGPIDMVAKEISGINNSDSQTYGAVTVNAQGQLCFKIDELNHSNQIDAIYNVCGTTPTSAGGVQ